MRKINDKSVSHTSTNNALQNGKKNESNIPKDGRFKELQVSFKDLHPEAHQPDVKKSIVVIGDSIIKNVNGRDVSRGGSVTFRPHPGASTEDLIDHIKPANLNEKNTLKARGYRRNSLIVLPKRKPLNL